MIEVQVQTQNAVPVLTDGSIDPHQFADIIAPHLSSTGGFRHEGDTVELREEVVQALHAVPQGQVWSVQTGLNVVPATNRNTSALGE